MSPRRSRPRHQAPTPPVIPGDPDDGTGFPRIAGDWLEHMAMRDLAPHTVWAHAVNLARFVAWAGLRGVTQPAEVTLPVLEAYQRHVSLLRKADGMPLSITTQLNRLTSLRVFFSWCAKQRRVLFNPASGMTLPRQQRSLPKATLTHDEAEQIMALCDTDSPTGLRDRAVLEAFYATGMRRGELAGIDLSDVDLTRRWVTLRDTKTRWDRVVPLGERAASWITAYLAAARPQLATGDDDGALFLGANGQRLAVGWLTVQVRRYIDAADLGKTGSCHLWRHTAGTLMVEHGADIRIVQELLGHRELSSTQIYTRVAPARLAAIHAATHPGAVLPAADDSPDGQGDM
jgi:integrase/recombinase XerD